MSFTSYTLPNYPDSAYESVAKWVIPIVKKWLDNNHGVGLDAISAIQLEEHIEQKLREIPDERKVPIQGITFEEYKPKVIFGKSRLFDEKTIQIWSGPVNLIELSR